jgi:hypothetical protein
LPFAPWHWPPLIISLASRNRLADFSIAVFIYLISKRIYSDGNRQVGIVGRRRAPSGDPSFKASTPSIFIYGRVALQQWARCAVRALRCPSLAGHCGGAIQRRFKMKAKTHARAPLEPPL